MKIASVITLFAAVGVLGTTTTIQNASANPTWDNPPCTKEGCPQRPVNPFRGCEWEFATANRDVTARCDGDSFVVSGGCTTDAGSFRTGMPTGVGDDDPITQGTGWRCETTANQPITAAALCCPGAND